MKAIAQLILSYAGCLLGGLHRYNVVLPITNFESAREFRKKKVGDIVDIKINSRGRVFHIWYCCRRHRRVFDKHIVDTAYLPR